MGEGQEAEVGELLLVFWDAAGVGAAPVRNEVSVVEHGAFRVACGAAGVAEGQNGVGSDFCKGFWV